MPKEISLTYYAKITKEGDCFLVHFRDFKNVFSEGHSIQEVLHNAQEALDGVLLTLAENDGVIPLPSHARKGEYPVPVSVDVAAPILLHILRLSQRKTLSDVARRLKVPYQQYQRLEYNCNMTLRSLKKAAAAMGARVEIKVYLDKIT